MRTELLVKLSQLGVGREVTFSYPSGETKETPWGTMQPHTNRWLVITRVSLHNNGNWTVEGFTNGLMYKRFSVDLMRDLNQRHTQYGFNMVGMSYQTHDCPF